MGPALVRSVAPKRSLESARADSISGSGDILHQRSL
jgi:hypothetical protein